MNKKLNNEIETFWGKWVDRRYMKYTVYPSIGNYLKNKKTKRVLDIGAQWFNVNNKYFFHNDKIDYWVIDINDKPSELKCDKFLRSSILDLTTTHKKLRLYFNVVISFGVLGWHQFEEKDIKKYLKNVHKILKPNGIFILKLDIYLLKEWEKKFNIKPKLINKYFIETSIDNLPKRKILEQKLEDKTAQVLFLTLKKK